MENQNDSPEDLLGQLTPEEHHQIVQHKTAYDDILRTLGDLDVRRSILAQRAIQIDEEAKQVIAKISERLNLTGTNANWAIRPNGAVVRASQ